MPINNPFNLALESSLPGLSTLFIPKPVKVIKAVLRAWFDTLIKNDNTHEMAGNIILDTLLLTKNDAGEYLFNYKQIEAFRMMLLSFIETDWQNRIFTQ